MTELKAQKKYCDLVMKGGVTSGVVYPLAVQKLATEYWFKNIGGTSAGAIAAGVTAAAECRRRRAREDSGFDRVAKLPEELAGNSFLLSLFRPDPATKRIFEVLLAGMSAKQSNRSVWVAVLRNAVKEAITSLLKNWFGFCTGFDPESRPGTPPLTNWLYSLLNEISGQDAGVPLTFRDLWEAPAYEGEDQKPAQLRCTEQQKRAINLEVMTTNLTLGCPSRIPFESKGFYWSPKEWSKFFPAEVVDWMVKHQAASDRTVRNAQDEHLLPLPEMRDLPIIVAIRMSLSFPILLCAVPLYAIDFTLQRNFKKPKSEPTLAERCWFSDGGISSNFPIHFFDSPLPRWPTFGI